MDLRRELVRDFERGVFSVTDLAERFGVSRKTVYKWVARHAAEGPPGLRDRSRRPLGCSHATSPAVVELILELHRVHQWGAKKVRRLLADRIDASLIPCVATISAILERNGCVTKRRRRPRIGHPGPPTSLPLAPNDVWSADFKGQFKTRDGRYCYPLTITDNCSRFILACHGLPAPSTAGVRPVFTSVFRTYGLPTRIRTDNGAPFAAISLARLSRLSVWWIRLGILPDLIEPASPQQNGRHERMHRTLKADTTRPPAGNRIAQQRKFNHFVDLFNSVRPHEALDLETPASKYSPSPRPFPETLPPIEYPAHFEVRRVATNAGIRWRSTWVNVSRVLETEWVGLEEVDNGIWDVYFGPVRLGKLHEDTMRIVDANGCPYRTKKRLNCHPCP